MQLTHDPYSPSTLSPYPPTVGTKKTLWVNFQEICNTMKRNPEHLFQFMMAELGTEGSIDGNKRLVIRGKFVPKVSHPSFLIAL